jgi:predicted DCC family thiol-disulfide oxidoreductase YuxK
MMIAFVAIVLMLLVPECTYGFGRKNSKRSSLLQRRKIGKNTCKIRCFDLEVAVMPHQEFQDMNRERAMKKSKSRHRAMEKAKKIDLLYDGDCPICMMEVEFLQKRDIKQMITFTDLQDPNYNPADHGNVSFESGMRKLRAVLPDGEVVKGIDVFRATYEAIDLGWIFALTKIPIIGDLADNFYDLWAANRLRLTGKGDLADILEKRAEELKAKEPIDDCEDGCDIDWDEMPDLD